MPFEKFTLTGKSYQPKISIRANGQIGFNQGAVEKCNLKNFEFVVLYFDKDAKRIGMRPTNEKEDGVCKIQIRDMNGAVGAKSFLDYYSVDYKKTERYDPTWDDTNKMIVISLMKEKTEVSFLKKPEVDTY